MYCTTSGLDIHDPTKDMFEKFFSLLLEERVAIQSWEVSSRLQEVAR